MAFNGSGLFQRLYNFGNDALNAIFIRADRMDAEMDGFAAGLSNAITRDGQGKPIATMDWNGQNLTNAGTITAISFVGTTPTMPLGTNDTRLVNAASLAAAITANTAGVSTFNTRTGAITLTQADIASAGGVSMFNSRSGAITLTSADITGAGGALSSSSPSGALLLTGGTMSGAINMGGNTIGNLASPVSIDQATSKYYVDTFYFPKVGGAISGNLISYGTSLTVANPTISMHEVVIPGAVAYGMYISNSSSLLRFSRTNGGGVVISDLMTLSPAGELSTSQIGDLATALNTKTVPGRVSAHATAIAEFGAVVAGFDNTVDCPAPYVMVGLRTVSGVSGQFIIRGVQLKST